jgi:hypothetical protein
MVQSVDDHERSFLDIFYILDQTRKCLLVSLNGRRENGVSALVPWNKSEAENGHAKPRFSSFAIFVKLLEPETIRVSPSPIKDFSFEKIRYRHS